LTRNRCGLFSGYGMVVGFLATCWVTPVRSAPESGELQPLRGAAEKLEAEKRWEQASDAYAELLTRDPGDLQTRDHYLRCMRHALLGRRYRDPSFRDLVLNQDASALLQAYREVLTKLRANYADEQKTAVLSLFREGLEQLRLDLTDEFFRKTCLPGAAADSIKEFDRRLARIQANLSIRDLREAQAKALEIARAAHEALGLKPGVTIMELAAGACGGLDEHTFFLTPSQLREMGGVPAGDAANVGIDVALVDQKPVVAQVLPGSPAATEGIRVGDRIVQIDKQRVDGLSVVEIGDRLQGEVGTSVRIQVRTPGGRSRRFTLTRQALAMPSVQAQLLDGQKGIGYVQIATFEKSTPQELDEAILHLRAEGMRALIVDLRGNPGGSLEAAIQVVERFIPDGVIVCTQSRVGQYCRTYRARNSNAWAIPLVVLINPGTASAAEVAAGAWKDRQRATLVGEPTFGKACIQGILPLETVPSGIRLTIARFFSPRGKSYSGSGVTPHILVPQPQESLHDQQLEAALQEAIRHTDIAQ
jgi:carboxyl-terminal processing protease